VPRHHLQGWIRCPARCPPGCRGSRADRVRDRGLRLSSLSSTLLGVAALAPLNLGIEGGRIFAFDKLIGVVVRRETGDSSVDNSFVGYSFPSVAVVAVSLRLGLVFLPLDLVRRLGRVMFHGDLLLLGQLAGHLLKLFDAGKLVNVFQAEAEEEVFGCFVENRSADDLFPASGGDELARPQTAQNAAGADAADFGALGGGSGLFGGDYRKGLECLEGELQ